MELWQRFASLGGTLTVGAPAELVELTRKRPYSQIVYRAAPPPDPNQFSLKFGTEPGWRVTLASQEQAVPSDAVAALAALALHCIVVSGPQTADLRKKGRRGEHIDGILAPILTWWAKTILQVLPLAQNSRRPLAEQAWSEMGDMLGSNTQSHEAVEWLLRLAKESSSPRLCTDARLKSSCIQVAQGNYEEALQTIDVALESDFRDVSQCTELLLCKARALRRLKRYDEARDVALLNLRRSAAVLNPGQARNNVLFLGNLALRRGNIVGLWQAGRQFVQILRQGQLLRRRRERNREAARRRPDLPLVAAPSPDEVRRIAVSRLDGLGDLVLSEPALRLLREHFPAATIDLFVPDTWAELPQCLGWADRVHGMRVVFRNNFRHLDQPVPKFEPFDLCIDLMCHIRPSQNQLLGALEAKVRLGFDDPSRRWRCNLVSPLPGASVHAADAFVGLLAPLGIEQNGLAVPRIDPACFPLDKANLGELAGVLAAGRTVGVHPGAGWPLRKWFPERLAEVADSLAQHAGCPIVILGSSQDLEMMQQIRAAMKHAPRMFCCQTLGQLAAILSHVKMLICHDSGPMHLAGAMGTPRVVVWGPGSRSQYGPRGQRCGVIHRQPLCAPCCQEGTPQICGMGHSWREVECLASISASEVSMVARQMYDSISGVAQENAS